MFKNIQEKFKGTSSSFTDILPCAMCFSLRSRYVGNTDYYTRRYQCKDCGAFFRYDKRPVEQGNQYFNETENASAKLQPNNPNVAPAPSKLILPS